MAQFEKLQELWQAQTAPWTRPFDTAELTRSMDAYGRRQKVVNVVKTLLVLSTTVWGVTMLGSTPRAIAGFGLIAAAALSLIIWDWRNQRDLARSDFSKPSLRFIEERIARLQEQRDPYRRYYWGFMSVVVIGMNLAGPNRSWWTRVAVSALPFMGFEAGMWLRRKRYDLECGPLLRQLSQLRAALEERGE